MSYRPRRPEAPRCWASLSERLLLVGCWGMVWRVLSVGVYGGFLVRIGWCVVGLGCGWCGTYPLLPTLSPFCARNGAQGTVAT